MHQPIKDIIKNLLPNGSRGVPGDISQFPYWPPDLFAVTAYIAQISDCYCELLDFSENGLGTLLTGSDREQATFWTESPSSTQIKPNIIDGSSIKVR